MMTLAALLIVAFAFRAAQVSGQAFLGARPSFRLSRK